MSSIDRQAILDCLSRLVTPGIKLTALADELGVRKQEYAELRSQILDLVEDGMVHVLPGGAFALTPHGRPADPHAKPPAPPKAPAHPEGTGSLAPAPKQARANKPTRPPKPQTPWRAEPPRPP